MRGNNKAKGHWEIEFEEISGYNDYVSNSLKEVIANLVKSTYFTDYTVKSITYVEETQTATYTRSNDLPKLTNEYVPPLGYKTQDDNLVIDEEEAVLVIRAQGEMNEYGHLTPSTASAMRRIWKQHYKKEQS